MSKLIIFTAPSGAGKTTLVKHLLSKFQDLAFSISATTRDQRPHEKDAKDYYFLSVEKFKELISNGAFVEWEEVYTNQYYGTLKSEIERLWKEGKHIIFDIDVMGAKSIKEVYPKETLAVFVKPPSPEILLERLRGRKTESASSLKKRVEKAKKELSFETRFDKVLINDDLEAAFVVAEKIVEDFLKKEDVKKRKKQSV